MTIEQIEVLLPKGEKRKSVARERLYWIPSQKGISTGSVYPKPPEYISNQTLPLDGLDFD